MKWYASRKILATVISAFLISVVGGFFAINALFFSTPEETYTLPDGTVVKSKRVNILLLGIDARPGEKNTRTDTMIFVSIDPETKGATVISIPRDTRVKIPNQGYRKINSANVYGGTELVEKTVEDLLGVPVHYYVLTNFDGFKDIIDTIGGITLDVEKNMYYGYEGINLKKGVQTLDGDKALQYVRYRSDALGDIGRTERQQKFIKALASEMLQVKNVTKLPKLIPQISRAVDTNMSVTEMAKMANMAKSIDSTKIVSQTLPGNFATINGGSYWAVDEKKVKDFVKGIMVSGKTTEVVDETVSAKPSGDSGLGKKNYVKEEPKVTKPVAPTPPKVIVPVVPPSTNEDTYGGGETDTDGNGNNENPTDPNGGQTGNDTGNSGGDIDEPIDGEPINQEQEPTNPGTGTGQIDNSGNGTVSNGNYYNPNASGF